jgi:hypothetical protein
MSTDRYLICPLSLRETEVTGAPARCSCCNEILPPLYVSEGQGLLPLPIQLFGLSGHGKTTYLAALTMALQRVNSVWNGFTATPATEQSRKLVRDSNVYFASGQLPPATSPGSKGCYLMLLNRIPKWIKAALMIRDCSGQAFQDVDIDLQEASYLLRAPLTFLFISLKDLQGGDTVDVLLNYYLNALAAHGVRPEPELKRIVVVLTKADLLQEELPDDLLNDVQEDRIWQASRVEAAPQWFAVADMDAHLGALGEISQRIEAWICRRAAGRTLVTLARDRNIEIRFTLISSTGSAPRAQDNVLATGWEPSRVLDPLIWALELNEKRVKDMRRYFR